MSNSGYHTRAAIPADAPALAALGERTFRDTFVADNTPEDLARHVAAIYGPARQAAELADTERTTLVAVTDAGELIGVAQALMTAALGAATARGAITIRLGVWERNPRAIAFYVKWGFRDVGSHEFVLGSDRQTDRVMLRPVAGGRPARAV